MALVIRLHQFMSSCTKYFSTQSLFHMNSTRTQSVRILEILVKVPGRRWIKLSKAASHKNRCLHF